MTSCSGKGRCTSLSPIWNPFEQKQGYWKVSQRSLQAF